MTEAERIARAQRASSAYSEFIEPMLAELRQVYGERLIEVANTELDASKRADKITALSNALKIIETLDSGMAVAIQDGEMASRDKLRADKIESMTRPQRRLLGIGPYQ